jgi:hypothetical protein
MNDDDLRCCFAMMLTVGMVIKGNGIDPMAIWDTADELVDARRVKEEPQGIVAIKKKRNAK